MSVLLSLCNTYSLRPSFFICTEAKDIELKPSGVKHQWFFNSRKMQERIENEITKTEAQRQLKCGWYNPIQWTREDTQVSKILLICNTFRWNIGDFVNDRTLDKISPWENYTEMLLEILRLKKRVNRELELHDNAYGYAAEQED